MAAIFDEVLKLLIEDDMAFEEIRLKPAQVVVSKTNRYGFGISVKNSICEIVFDYR